jgi:hypothetical protein
MKCPITVGTVATVSIQSGYTDGSPVAPIVDTQDVSIVHGLEIRQLETFCSESESCSQTVLLSRWVPSATDSVIGLGLGRRLRVGNHCRSEVILFYCLKLSGWNRLGGSQS